MAQADPPFRGSKGAGGANVLGVLQGARLGANDPCKPGPRHQPDGHGRKFERGTQERRQQQEHEEPRQDGDEFREPHQRRVNETARRACGDPEAPAHHERQHHRHSRQDDRTARAMCQHRQQVAPQVVGSEKMAGTRGGKRRARSCKRIVRGDDPGGKGRQQNRHKQDERKVAHLPPPPPRVCRASRRTVDCAHAAPASSRRRTSLAICARSARRLPSIVKTQPTRTIPTTSGVSRF